MHPYLGSFTPGSTIYLTFNTVDTDGAPIVLGGTPVVQCYKNASTTEDNSGITLTTDFDSRVGLAHVAIDTSADATFYADASEVFVAITTGTVDAISVVGKIVGEFSLAAAAGVTLTTAERAAVADALLDRDMSTGTDSGSPTVRTARQALRAIRNKVSVSGGTATITKEDDSTASWTATVTGTPAVTAVDPAS